jgi:hypothetical protein
MSLNTKFAAALLPLLAAAILAGGCGGGSDNSTSPSEARSGAPAARDPEQQAALSECLRDNGVEVPTGETLTPGELPDEVDEDAFRAAMQECRGAAGGSNRGGGGSGQAGLQGLLDCLRAEGLDVPEDAAPGEGLSQLDTTSPEFQEAFDKCRSGGQGG